METMTANYSRSPHSAQTSHLRDAHPMTTSPTPKSTRTVQAADAHRPTQLPLSAPASQESFVSLQSSIGSSVPQLHSSDSNWSQLTADTDQTSPASSSSDSHAAILRSALQHSSHIQRNRTPENAVRRVGDVTLASPMSITSPAVINGAKRTASGHVKNPPSLTNTPYTGPSQGRHSRRESLSSSGSRAGELAATLKTRLGYAMAKVQHGWEHKSLDEVEQLAAQKTQSDQYSVSHLDQSRPSTSGLSNGAANLSVHEAPYRLSSADVQQPPSKRHSGNYGHFMCPPQRYHPGHAAGPAPRLQPAPDIRPTSSSGSRYRTEAPQKLVPLQYHTSAMSPPRTPISEAQPRRPPTIRTEIQTAEAEREALQSLLQLGSPHTSQMPRGQTTNGSQCHGTTLNTDLTPRRVTFARSESASTTSSGIVSRAREVTEEQPRLGPSSQA